MILYDVEITHRDSCKTYPLRRLGLSHLIDWDADKPTIKDLYESKDFDHLTKPVVGCILIWTGKEKESTEGYWQPHRITEDGKIVSVKRFDYGHCGVYEKDGYVSDARWIDGDGTQIYLRKYEDLPKPDYILKYSKNKK